MSNSNNNNNANVSSRPYQSYDAECDMVRRFMESHDISKGVTWQQLKDWNPPDNDGIPTIERFSIHEWEYFIYEEEPEIQFKVFKDCGLTRILEYPLTKIKDIAVEDNDRLVAVVAPVVAMTEIKPDWASMYYQCNNCNHKEESKKSSNYKAPKQCTKCAESGSFDAKFYSDETRAVNMQGIILQEESLQITAVWTGGKRDMWKVKDGQRAYALGLAKFEAVQNRQSGKVDIKKYIQLLHIEPLSGNEIVLTEKDKERFMQYAQDPEFLYQLVLNSFAPHIHGNRDQKEVCVYTLASQNTKRPINSLLAGPSGRGKTRMLMYSADIPPDGTYQTFGDATAVGLTASVGIDKATGLAMRRKGIFGIYKFVAITELQSIQEKKDLKVQLNDALERKKVSIAKAGIHEEFSAACACLFDTNNFDGRWEYGQSLAYNLQFLAPNIAAFLSRMDLVSVVDQMITEEDDNRISAVNFDAYHDSDEPIDMHLEDWYDPTCIREVEQNTITRETLGLPPLKVKIYPREGERWGFETLRKYFFYVTSLPEPPVDTSLRQYYVDSYKKVKEHDYEALVDGRYHPSAMRLARNRARMLLKKVGDKRDIDEAMRLLNRSKNIVVAVNMLEPDGEKDGRPVLGVQRKVVAQAFFSEEEEFRDSIYKVMEKTGRSDFTLQELQDYMVDELSLPNWNKTKVKTTVKKWAFDTNQLKELGGQGSMQFAVR